MNTDRLTTILGFVTSTLGGAAAIAATFLGGPWGWVLGALAAASHAAEGYFTNKPPRP